MRLTDQPSNTAVRSGARSSLLVPVLALVIVAVSATPAEAYIGPGAGFAIASSLFTIIITFFLAFLTLLIWPIRWVIRAIKGRRAFAKSRIKRVVVLGLDGMEPTLTEKYMAEGKLPNLAKLAEQGTYKRLGTTLPPLTPVAWSTFLTGCNPGKHNIFDFLTVDRRHYLPELSSVYVGGTTKTLKLGKYLIPLGKPDIRMLRKGKPFWKDLGEHGIFSAIIRMPITFPPEKFRGVSLSAMCVPDIRGTQGMFSFYTTRSTEDSIYEGGEQIHVERKRNAIKSHLVGPTNSMRVDNAVMTAPFTVTLNGRRDSAELSLCGEKHTLKLGEYTPWINLHFKAAPGTKVHAICQFLLLRTEPEFELYVTPLQIDPEKPAMPISHPKVFSTYLAKSQGSFATMGLAEDTWAHNEKILQDPTFLHQCLEGDREREVMFFDALDKTKRGLVACVFDGTDRVQHMFWRYIDPAHPAHEGFGDERLKNAIPELFERMDDLVGRTMDKCNDDDTLLFVISDHGCKSFRYGVDLNRWLIDNGYMKLKEPANGKKYLATVDWSQTRAYGLGLSGIFLNLDGRERQGIVQAGAEADALREELCEKITGLRDPRHDAVAVNKAYNTHKCYAGPYTEAAPDVVVGYNEGYRVSWEAAIGDITDEVFSDNMKAWSGDHCIDPQIAPGVMFSNRKINAEAPRIMDFAPTILGLFGVDVPRNMDGRPLEVELGNGRQASAA
ncbi:MAG: alkaline phosphatase family protein [Phycisphaerae bacterium]|nr:alkaline phosphatase family protein [Phycisphaerae bacterium]